MGLDFVINPHEEDSPDYESMTEKEADDWHDEMYYPKGLDRVSFSYGGFADFRRKVAAAEGIDLDKMEGFATSSNISGMSGIQGPIPWDAFDTPLEPFLNHSDCEGHMTYEECQRVAPRLKAICEGWAETAQIYGGWYKQRGIALAELMLAVPKGQRLRFT